ncbi:uncharacterized protein LOC122511539 [Leptopilina heterotoma]|uniref:uncharacterized protein LOC122511539 n=1 Tax=Leptopilina heterotoma TaxID=63436 RepID=UPI001CA7E28B|nr:uncharacterized protein LOC122511539 [Leptopilina heterotoma]
MINAQKQQQKINVPNRFQQRTILKVVVEKIGKASATVHGDLSKQALKELLMSELSLISKIESFEKEDIRTSLNEIQECIDEEFTINNEEEILNDIDEVIEDHENSMTDLSINGNKQEEENRRKCDMKFSKNINKLDRKVGKFEKKLTKDGKCENKEKLGKNIYLKDTISSDRNFSASRKSQEILNDSPNHDLILKEENDEELNMSENNKWLKKYFKQPLTLAMTEIIQKKPSDPVNYLGFWLLNYRSLQKNREMEAAESPPSR